MKGQGAPGGISSPFLAQVLGVFGVPSIFRFVGRRKDFFLLPCQGLRRSGDAAEKNSLAMGAKGDLKA